MARIHAFELEDQTWFPGLIRQYMTDFLSFMGAWSKRPYEPFTERLAEALRVTGDARLIDLCSGGGGPALVIARDLAERLERPIALVLTDLYPTPSPLEHGRSGLPAWVELEPRSVDVRAVPDDLVGFRLICNGFHHLKPEEAQACLKDAVEKQRGMAVVELAQRSPFSMLQIVLGVGWQLLITPFIKPFRWSRLVFTYAVPIVPACTLWDGIVSCLRVYDPDELRRLISGLPENNYDWSCGALSVPKLPMRLTYLIGVPRTH
ncbi:MAG TPA: hypothetical protein VIW29_16600 [Polyangiaceae bacterium]